MNLLLVDDEIASVRILQRSVNWEEIGIRQVFCAYNAEEGRRVLEKKEIHIIICDMEMPQENGIQFLTWVQERYPHIMSVILTAYPNFNYAQDAVSLGVYKYMLKPVVYRELKAVVKEVADKLAEEERREVQRRYGAYYEKNHLKAEKIFFRELLNEEILPIRDYISREIKRRGMCIEKLVPGAAVLFHSGEKQPLVQEKSLVSFMYENIAEELFPAAVVLHEKEDIVWILLGSYEEDEVTAMCSTYVEKVREFLGCDISAYYLMGMVLSEVAQGIKILAEAAGRWQKKGQSVYPVRQWQEDMMAAEGVSQADGKRGPEHKAAQEVLDYVAAHYAEAISRKDVEELVHLNQDYLNRIFKYTTGYTLMEYIQYYRILKAKELLLDSDYSVSEIGGMVGYDNPPYFSKMFKKWTALTPMEYRSNTTGLSERTLDNTKKEEV